MKNIIVEITKRVLFISFCAFVIVGGFALDCAMVKEILRCVYHGWIIDLNGTISIIWYGLVSILTKICASYFLTYRIKQWISKE